MLASVTVSNATDLTNADTNSISALIANDGGDGISLREAIAASNNTVGADTISFDGSVFTGGAASLIRLTQGELVITEEASIDGSTATDVVITGDATGDDITVPGTFITDVAASFTEFPPEPLDLLNDNSRVIRFSDASSEADGTLTISRLTITGGRTTQRSDFGGGIFAESGTLTLIDSNVSGNSTSGDGAEGGGIRGEFVALQNSSVTGNSTSGFNSHGGGVSARHQSFDLTAVLSLTNSVISGNWTSGVRSNGGGVSASARFSLLALSLTNSTISGNRTLDQNSSFDRGQGGGAIVTGSVLLNNSSISDNTAASAGGGLRTAGGNIVVENNSSISGNTAGSSGGAIFTSASVDISIEDSLIANNEGSSGGGIWNNAGRLSLTRTIIRDNEATASGGGITSNGYLSINNSSITGNAAGFGGGGLEIGGYGQIVNSTISGNTATNGGGIFASFSGTRIELTNSTVTDNTAIEGGGGIESDSNLSIINSIVAGNTDDDSAPDVSRSATIGRNLVVEHSLIGDTTGSGITARTGSRNILNQPALLGPLADNGGPTLTHALLTGSPAIDAGSDTFAVDADGVPLLTDQRGSGFDRIQNGRIDLGAVESDFDAAAIAPYVVTATIDEGGDLARPDLWSTLTIVFDSDVTVAANDLSLINDSLAGTAVDLAGVGFVYDASANTATWDFSTLDPLDRAFYSFQLDSASITYEGLALDGNVDGTTGDNFIGQHYVAIPGDTNQDGVVDVLNDAFALVGNLGSTTELAWADGNFNGDGVVDVLGDAFVLVGNLNRDVRPMMATARSSVASVPSRSPVTVVFDSPLVALGDAGVQDETIRETTLMTSSLESPGLALAGAHELRDDVFASDF